jgi:ketosteroid isomerase-like protein
MSLKKTLAPPRALALLLALSLLAALAFAQGERGASAEMRLLVQTERAFARASAQKGMKEAFLSFAADDGVLFRRTVVNAKELWRGTTPAPTGLLTWRPAFADIARAGDAGYTFGPWEFRPNPADRDAAGHGQFVTFWRKQLDGTWKFEVDIGISHPAPPVGAEEIMEYVIPRGKWKPTTKGRADAEAVRASLLDAERELAKDAAARGSHEALLAHADEQVRLFRPNAFPLSGKAAARDALKAQKALVAWRAKKAGASSSGDLGYTYGAYEMRETASDAQPSEQGHYVRFWKRPDGGKWRVVLDITNPVGPAAQ